jgi:16S rRNA (guanine966-N2)-methyltransferase
MRVIAGEFRSRKLQSMPGDDIRPTSDKLRETLFDILNMAIEGVVFVDGYAGTGAVGIEALSRGARHAIFIEKKRAAADLIRGNLAALKIERRARVIHGPAALYLGGIEADMIFLDPPYSNEREYRAALDSIEAKPPELVIVQHSTRFQLAEECGALRRTRIVKQGENALSFFRKRAVPITGSDWASSGLAAQGSEPGSQAPSDSEQQPDSEIPGAAPVIA